MAKTHTHCEQIARAQLAQRHVHGKLIELPTGHWITHILAAQIDLCTTPKQLATALQITMGRPIIIPNNTIPKSKASQLVERHPNQRIVIYEM